ncbi:hypothetical protein [Larkinella rosea]|uniref:Uncharacterized protein n=1 Tax=Larkinella rosea TaxID=2025312 RepID=A0A3P1BTZ1_9BACT|nr:hypothetical protein [Larkinella rosea]RRB04373.1 hypothetical protein EHT25_12780 [Larkinella rosea]
MHEMEASDPMIVCPTCHWSGREADLDMDYSLLGEYSDQTCPKCSTVLRTVRTYLTAEEAQQQADAGNVWLQNAISYQDQISQSQLKSIDQLPDLAGETALEFVWECVNIPEEGRLEPIWIVIRLKSGEPIWRERSHYGNRYRFREFEKLLPLKYGERFKSIEVDKNVHSYTLLYWYGD